MSRMALTATQKAAEGGAIHSTVTDTREEEKRTDEALLRCFGGDV